MSRFNKEVFKIFEEAWAGGVGDLGDPEAAEMIVFVKGYPKYRREVVREVRNKYGRNIKVYRSMSVDEYKAWEAGMRIKPTGWTVFKDLALNWHKLVMAKNT